MLKYFYRQSCCCPSLHVAPHFRFIIFSYDLDEITSPSFSLEQTNFIYWRIGGTFQRIQALNFQLSSILWRWNLMDQVVGVGVTKIVLLRLKSIHYFASLIRSVEVTKLTTGRLVNGSSCDGIDMVIKKLDLEPKVYAMMRDFLEISLQSLRASGGERITARETCSKILPYGGWILLEVVPSQLLAWIASCALTPSLNLVMPSRSSLWRHHIVSVTLFPAAENIILRDVGLFMEFLVVLVEAHTTLELAFVAWSGRMVECENISPQQPP
ncbi:hypothetical protein Tco_0365012 [Tanacetum coccineum]